MIWLVLDGKPGHQNQSEGLLQALTARRQTDVRRLPVMPFWKTLKGSLLHRNFVLKALPSPDLVIGTGHRTHFTILLLARLYGARSVVLMKPSLPVSLFDLCLVPQHDGLPEKGNVVVTRGVLNRMQPAAHRKINQGVVLVGGPSKHFAWDEDGLLGQISAITHDMQHIHWLLADSRRTPASTSARLQSLQGEHVDYIACDSTDSDWLPQVLGESGFAWVTRDSVSMVYEALTAGASVGLLDVPEIRPGRVSLGVEGLIREKKICGFQDWQDSGEMPQPLKSFNEAQRCAGIVEKLCQHNQ